MIRRLLNIARAEFNSLMQKKDLGDAPLPEPKFYELRQEESDILVKYYANLEIPVGSDREKIKTADLHGSDPKKKQVAEELTRQLNKAYSILDSAFLKK